MLTEREARGLADLSRTILSIGDANRVDAWARSVETSFRQMLGADVVGLAVPVPESPVMFISSEAKQGAMQSYMRVGLPQQERMWGTKTRLLELQVSSRRSLHYDHLEAYYKSELWNELIVPERLFDTIAIACRIGPGLQAFAFLIHGQKTGRKFGRLGLNRLRTVFPVFRSAVRAAQHAPPVGDDLTRIIDAVPSALALADGTGRVLHRNASLADLIQREPERDRMLHAIDRLGRRLASLTHERAGLASLALWHERASDTVQLGAVRYRLSGSLLRATGASRGPRVMVAVERVGPPALPENALRARSLTRRELDIARLAVDGTSPAGIAATLGISLFTTRHHLENLMRKLGVHSLAALVALLARLAAESM